MPYPEPPTDDPVRFTNDSQDILTLNFGSDVQLIPITEEAGEVGTEVTTTEVDATSEVSTPGKEYKDNVNVEKKMEKKKIEKHNNKYNVIISTSSEVNEKSILPTSVSTLESTLDPSINVTSPLVDTALKETPVEGVGEATPILLDSSMSEIVSSSTEISTTSLPTQSLPSSSVILSTSVEEGIKDSTSSTKAAGNFLKIYIKLLIQ